MADVPRRVNAAQLAARKIKTGGSLRKKFGHNKPDVGDSVPLFASPSQPFDSTPSTGLFGGTVNATGGFSFSVPGPSISFGSPSGSTTPTEQPNNEDPRADTTGEEAARRNKPFRMSTDIPPAQSNNTLSAFGQANVTNSASMFQPAQPPLPSNGFSFGSSSTNEKPANSPFTFGQNTQAPPASTPFSFGGSSQNSMSSNPFAFGQNSAQPTTSFGFGSSQNNSSTTPFAFGQSTAPAQPASTGISFGGTPAVEKPATTSFSFGQSNSTPKPESSGISFGSAPATEKPASAIFSFGQTSAVSQPASTGTSFGSTPAAATGNTFSFGKPSGQAPATTSGNNIENTPAVAQSTTNPFTFGQTQPQGNPQSPGFSFGSTSTQTKPSNGGFGSSQAPSLFGNSFGQQNEEPKTKTTNAGFGTQEQQSEKPASSLFGSQVQNGPTTSLFGGASNSAAFTNGGLSAQTTSAPKLNMFGSQSTQPTQSPNKEPSPEKDTPLTPSADFGSQHPTNSLFGNKAQDAPKNIFGGFSSTKPATPAPSNIFGNKAQPSAPSNIFGQSSQSQPAKINSESAQTSVSTSESEKNSSPSSLFSSLRPQAVPASLPEPQAFGEKRSENATVDESTPRASASEPEQPTANGILAKVSESAQNSTPSVNQPPKQNLFSSMKPFTTPAAPPASSFPNLQPPTKSDSTNIFAKSSAVQQATPAARSTTNALQRISDQDKVLQSVEQVNGGLQPDIKDIGKFDEELMESRIPQYFTAAQKAEFRGAYAIRALNAGLQSFLASVPMGADYAAPLEYYKKRRDEIVTNTQNLVRAFKRKADDGGVRMIEGSPSKRSKIDPPASASHLSTQATAQSAPSPNKPAVDAAPARSLFSSPTKSSSFTSSSTTPKAPAPAAPQFFAQQTAPVDSPTPKAKRKAEVQLTKDDPTGEEEEGRSPRKQAKLQGSPGGSQTSNIFRNILESGPSPSSPDNRVLSATKTPDKSTDPPRQNPFATIPMAAQNGTTPAAETGFGATTSGLTDSSGGLASKPSVDSNAQASTASNIFEGKAGQSLTQSNPFAGNTFSGSPSNPKETLLNSETSQDATPVTDGEPSASTTTASSSLFIPKPTETTPTNLFGAKGAAAPSATKNFFQFKPSTSSPLANSFLPPASASSASTDVKPPTFGSGSVNFLAQFGQQAQKDKEDAEKKAMERAKLEDLDSDDDEAEWEANWKKKREEEKKALEEIAKSKRAAFVPGKGFSFSGSTESAEPVEPLFGQSNEASGSTIFGQSTTAPSSKANSFTSKSGPSSPGAASNGSGSVFENIPASHSTSFSGNIFGHLSDVDSGTDRKGDDADDDDTEGEDDVDRSDPEQDEEKKDPTYEPGAEGSNDPGTPGTPPERTGPGIASAKKATISESNDFSTPSKPNSLFNFASTTTPTPRSGGLFDRISKDSDGNPIRHVPAENKENAGPNTTNIFTSTPFGASGSNPFAAMNKPPSEVSKSPGVNTWKPDTPIKFGNATSPTVNFTSATPTQTSPFAGLFGSNNTPKPSLFANLNPNKPPTVGFNFGSSSTPASSLAPSGVVSNTTSRATSPGATTDNSSTNEAGGDPHAEHHEQVDLTKGGVGEEDEEVLHEVRAKALKFSDSKSGGEGGWIAQGVGPLKVLKHKETKASRVLLRADPSGKVVLNKAILEQIKYEATGKTIKLLTADDNGKGLEAWLVQVKTEPMAKDLAQVLETNKTK